MEIYTIDTELFKLDGGAMFGVVPKGIWQRKIEADENNLCTWAMRCLLIQTQHNLILIDTGIGNKQDAKFLSHYHLHGDATLLSSIAKAGFSPEEITDVVLTHLHFDHVGGAVYLDSDQKPKLTFPNARYWSNEAHWDWATNPNPREKASFLDINILPIQESGQLHFIEAGTSPFEDISFIMVDGHTEKQMLPHLHRKGKPNIIYVADLLPSTHHLRLPYVMGYDVRPLLTMKEKEEVLQLALDTQSLLYFEHDAYTVACSVKASNRGVVVDERFDAASIF